MAKFSTAEPRSVCLSVSKKNQDAKDIAESWATAWNMDLAPALWRIVREHNQMKKWNYYNNK